MELGKGEVKQSLSTNVMMVYVGHLTSVLKAYIELY